jgi:spore coat protein U-like protein
MRMGWVESGIVSAFCLTAGALATSQQAAAAFVSGDLHISITIQSECQIAALPDLNFGTHGVISTAVSAFTDIQIQCTNTTPFDIGLDEGDGTSATVADRLLGDTVNYSLYQDAAHNTVWGNTIDTDTVAGTGDGTAQSFRVYGLVPVQATPIPGTYNDTVAVTVTY